MPDAAPTQVEPVDRWPSGDGRPIAVLDTEPDELTTRFGIVFVEDVDDLGSYRLAALQILPDTQVWLVRYEHSPVPGLEVHADARQAAPRLLARLLDVFAPIATTWVVRS
jgi:hypothetical protein